jgi:RNA polymerase sigma-70 factor (ECF subfamily)
MFKGQNKQPSFAALIRPHLDRMYRLAYRLTGHREDAQDLVQDVLLKLHTQMDRLAEVEAVATWLGRVMYNQFIDNQPRYKSRRLTLVEDPVLSAEPDNAPSVEASTEDQAEGEFTITRVLAAMERLSDEHQVIIKLHDVEGYTITEIAEITGIPHGTLKSRRQRARERLQDLLDEGPDRAVFASGEGRGEENDELRTISAQLGSVSRR